MNDSFLLLMNPNFAPYWGGQGPPLVPFFVAPMYLTLGLVRCDSISRFGVWESVSK